MVRWVVGCDVGSLGGVSEASSGRRVGSSRALGWRTEELDFGSSKRTEMVLVRKDVCRAQSGPWGD